MIILEQSHNTPSACRAFVPGGAVSFAVEGNRSAVGPAALFQSPGHRLDFTPSDPSVAQAERRGKFTDAERDNILCLLASPDARFGSLPLNAAARIYTCQLGATHQITFRLKPDTQLRIILLDGQLSVGDKTASTGDHLTISELPEIQIQALTDSEFFLLELS